MPLEIERKFKVLSDKLDFGTMQGLEIFQGYLKAEKELVVRVRLEGDQGFLTIKGITKKFTRDEFEYQIPEKDARIILKKFCTKVIHKTRYKIEFYGFIWEVDVFQDNLQDLILAEIELESEQQEFPKPDWLGQEVSHDPNYFNSNLVELVSTKKS